MTAADKCYHLSGINLKSKHYIAAYQLLDVMAALVPFFRASIFIW